jgi:hypothetical protein
MRQRTTQSWLSARSETVNLSTGKRPSVKEQEMQNHGAGCERRELRRRRLLTPRACGRRHSPTSACLRQIESTTILARFNRTKSGRGRWQGTLARKRNHELGRQRRTLTRGVKSTHGERLGRSTGGKPGGLGCGEKIGTTAGAWRRASERRLREENGGEPKP